MEVDRLIQQHCDEFFEKLVASDRKDRRTATPDRVEMLPYVYSEVLEDEAERMISGDRRSVLDEAHQIVKNAGVTLSGDEFDRLCWELQRTLVRVYRTCGAEWEGDFSGEARLGPHPAIVAPKRQGSKPLSEIVAEFVQEHEDKAWTEKTGRMIKKELSDFLEFVGDKAAGEIARDEIRSYRAIASR